MTSIIVLVALALDRLLGEPRRAHPLEFFGAAASRLEKGLRGAPSAMGVSVGNLRLLGCVAWAALVLVPSVCLDWLLDALSGGWHLGFSTIVLYACIGHRSLVEHCRAIASPLAAGEEEAARAALAMIVSRDTGQLGKDGVARGALESLLENGSDAVVAPLFWFIVAGAPGALCYRLANTLDAMWGYRNERFRDFGWCAARMDDVLNLLPARVCALAYALVGRSRSAISCWWLQARQHNSPNAGPVIASGAGALAVQLGGPASYGGEVRWRPRFGVGCEPGAADIERGIALLNRALGLLVILLLAWDIAW